jgi:alkanesulfonate monooxygenase SsuD/methylene tetrahydromethanopterin reductase-like flavin-dependent oxidoreductase (luciferase family)
MSQEPTARQPLRLGFMSHVSGLSDPATVLEQTTRLFVIAEELGYDSVWVAQHHVGAECGHLPSPFVLLAAVAARTSRIRLGTAVVTLPLEDPVRTAEDAAVADLISGGRIELGVGTCPHQPSFLALGRDFEARQEVQRTSLATLTTALRGEPLPGRTRLAPHAPGLADRIWQATSSVESALGAARAGRGLLLARGAPRTGEPVDAVQRPIAEAYLKTWRVGRPDAPPRLGITRTVYPTTDRQTAIRHLEAGTRQWSQEMLPGLYPPDLDAEELFARHSIYAGAPADVLESLARDRALRLATDLVIQLQPGLPTFGQAVMALEAVATEIAPALGWQPASRR